MIMTKVLSRAADFCQMNEAITVLNVYLYHENLIDGGGKGFLNFIRFKPKRYKTSKFKK